MKKMQEKRKIHNIQDKTPTPPQTKANHKLPLKPSHMDGKHQFPPVNQQIEKNQGV
jgi:hypothetical protein